MIRCPLTHRALAIAHMAHANQTDKAGVPYVEHVLHVAEQMPDEVSTAVALLHDSIEDSNGRFTAQTLLNYGIPAEVVENVVSLTRTKDQTYADYIGSLKDKPIARMVKLADLRHNSDLTRYEVIPLEAKSLQDRYLKAIKVLESVDREEEEVRTA